MKAEVTVTPHGTVYAITFSETESNHGPSSDRKTHAKFATKQECADYLERWFPGIVVEWNV